MRIQRIRVERVAQPESPGELGGDPPGVLRVDIEVQEAKRFVRGQRKRLRRGRSHSIDELGQRGIGYRGDASFAEIVIVQSENPGVRSEPQLVAPVAPGQVVVQKIARGASTLEPGVVQAPDGSEGIGTASLQDNGKGGEGLLEIALRKQAFVPGKARIEIVDQVL